MSDREDDLKISLNEIRKMYQDAAVFGTGTVYTSHVPYEENKRMEKRKIVLERVFFVFLGVCLAIMTFYIMGVIG